MENKTLHAQTTTTEYNMPYQELLLKEIKEKTHQNSKLHEKVKSIEEHIDKNTIKCREYVQDYSQARQVIANRMENAYTTLISYKNKLAPYSNYLKGMCDLIETYTHSKLNDSLQQQFNSLLPDIQNTIKQYTELMKYEHNNGKDLSDYTAYRAANLKQIGELLKEEA